jgi:hypothetical protein
LVLCKSRPSRQQKSGKSEKHGTHVRSSHGQLSGGYGNKKAGSGASGFFDFFLLS